MGNPYLAMMFFLFLIIVSNSVPRQALSQQPLQATFIVHVSRSHKPKGFTSPNHMYTSILGSLPQSPQPAKLVYSYNHAVHGFAASLSPSQLSHLLRAPGVLSVSPDRARRLHTTHTPAFLGLDDSAGLWPNSNYADDVIVGVLDTGVWPERRSFSDAELSPVPGRWKGTCEVAKDFPATACNRKIIGARFFYKGYEAAMGRPIDEEEESKSPRDTEGHGTHTASTAAGAAVSGAGFYRFANGVAKGMATRARIAAYKICWRLGCFDSDILAAMDSAIADGVDVISLSVGASGYAPPYYDDSIAIGAFGAAQHGVVVSCSAGNSGPGPFTANNIAPWILTVGASTVDREFPADVVLGDGTIYPGVSLYFGGPLNSTQLPMIYGADCGSSYCLIGSLDPSKVAGKIVICDRGGNARAEKGGAVKLARGLGMILANTPESGEELIADSHLIPATMVGQAAGDRIRQYARTRASPTATILFRGTVFGSKPAPKVASFSSRGPNFQTPEILKPDVIAPGVNILAAWTGLAAPTELEIDPRRVEFNIISGTSMSCPHVSGLAALLRKAHPTWSPAAIKSALMTSSYNLDNAAQKIEDLATGIESTPFIHGAGHVDPNRALDPGLVYDTEPKEYLAFFCAIGYELNQIAVFVDPSSINCSATSLASPGDLNYPSFSVVFQSHKDVVRYKRMVTNVGPSPVAVYEASIVCPPSVKVNVSPAKLEFDAQNRSLTYEITFAAIGNPSVDALRSSFGSITWSDGLHEVRSPIAVTWRHGQAPVSSLVSSM